MFEGVISDKNDLLWHKFLFFIFKSEEKKDSSQTFNCDISSYAALQKIISLRFVSSKRMFRYITNEYTF